MFSAVWTILKQTVLGFINDEALSRGAAIVLCKAAEQSKPVWRRMAENYFMNTRPRQFSIEWRELALICSPQSGC
jgi:hypothetical protein